MPFTGQIVYQFFNLTFWYLEIINVYALLQNILTVQEFNTLYSGILVAWERMIFEFHIPMK